MKNNEIQPVLDLKRKLINNIYLKINNKHHFNGNNKLVEKVIGSFIEREYDNKCSTCGKPNWEKLSMELGLEHKLDFVGTKCGYCSQPQPKQFYKAIASGVGFIWGAV